MLTSQLLRNVVMYPEDRVLVGVINRKRDLLYARDAHWYRIPLARMARTVDVEYLAFFLSGAFGPLNGAIHYYARRRGLELVRRRDLMPDEARHRRADAVYYKVELGALSRLPAPITNPSRRPISFIYTTWDRFVRATVIGDLYSRDDHFVDRFYHAQCARGLSLDRDLDAEKRFTGEPEGAGDTIVMDNQHGDAAGVIAIGESVQRPGGPASHSIPLEGS